MRLFSKNEIGVFDDLNTTAFLTLPYTSVNLQLSIMQSVLDGSYDDEETSEKRKRAYYKYLRENFF